MTLSSIRNLSVVVAAALVAVGCGGSEFSAAPADAGSGEGGAHSGGAGRGAGGSNASAGSESQAAGASDGGASDGGASDGGASDGGASNAGANDGGANDGGANDGGANDGGAAGELGSAGRGAGGAQGGVGGAQGGAAGVHGGGAGSGGALGTSGSTGTSGASNGGSGGSCTAVSWFPDGDGDGFGRTSGEVVACEAPAIGGWVAKGGDCNDDNETVFPMAPTSSDEGYVLSGGGVSFDYDCSGTEEVDTGQLGAAPTCSVLSCNGKGFQSTDRTDKGQNALCGSKMLVTCTSGTLSCASVVSKVLDGVRCH